MRHRSLEEPPPHRPSASSVLSPQHPTPLCREQIPPPRIRHTPNCSRHPADPKITAIQKSSKQELCLGLQEQLGEGCRRHKNTQIHNLCVSCSAGAGIFPKKPFLTCAGAGAFGSAEAELARAGAGSAGAAEPLARTLPAIPEPHFPGAAEGKGGRGSIITCPSSELQRVRKTRSEVRLSFGERGRRGAASRGWSAASKDTSHLPAVPNTFCVCERAQSAQVTNKAVPDRGKPPRAPALLPHLPPSRLQNPV